MCLGLQHLALTSPPCLCDMLRSVAQNAEDGGGQGPRAARYGCGPQLFMLSHTGTSLARRSHCIFAAVTTQTAHRFGLSLACHAIDAWTECCLVGCCDSYLLFGTWLCAGLNVKQNRGDKGASILDAPAETTCTRRRDHGPLVKTLFSAALSLSLFSGAHGMPNHCSALHRSRVFHLGMIFIHSFEFGQTLDLAEHNLHVARLSAKKSRESRAALTDKQFIA